MNMGLAYHRLFFFIGIMVVSTLSFKEGLAQENQLVRLAKLVVDPVQLQNYRVQLKEEIEASVRIEPGVLTLYAVSDKENPTHFTILEIYADKEAYQSHVKTPHFLKYKNGTKNMVTSLELTETVPLVAGMKIK